MTSQVLVQTHIRLPNFGIQVRLTDDFVDDHAGPPQLLTLLRHLAEAELRFHGPGAWGPSNRVLEVIGDADEVARAAAAAGNPLDKAARRRLARDGWFVFGKRGQFPDVHVRVVSCEGNETMTLLVAAFRRSEVRFSGPGWRFQAAARRDGFCTAFGFVDLPSEAWLVEVLAGVAARQELPLSHESRRGGRVDARIGDLDLTFDLHAALAERERFDRWARRYSGVS
jgi:hypothetical protein